MRLPFRKSNLRDRILELGSQFVVLAFTFLFCLWMISGAKAEDPNNLIDIKSETSGENRFVEISFTRDISADSVKASYERDFLQFSVENVTAFPAKTVETGGEQLSKVYAYQYQPNLARARVYITGDPKQVKGAITWTVEANRIRVVFDQQKFKQGEQPKYPVVKTVSKPAVAADMLTSTSSSTIRAAEKASPLTPDEEQLLKRMTERLERKEAAATTPAAAAAPMVAAQTTPAAAPVIAAPAAAAAEDPLFDGMKKDAKRPDGPAKAANLGLGKVVLNLFLVLGLIAALAWGFRKFVLKRGLGLGQNTNAIKVLSNFTLAPGKQISVVKVADEYLVLGITGSNISLISTLDRASGIEKYFGTGASSGRGAAKSEDRFGALLDGELGEFEADTIIENVIPEAKPQSKGVSSVSVSVRDSIKDRLRGFKQLT